MNDLVLFQDQQYLELHVFLAMNNCYLCIALAHSIKLVRVRTD